MSGAADPDTLVGADPGEVRDAVRRHLESFAPDVVVTLDAGDGHRDHAAIRDATLAAVDTCDLAPTVYLHCLPSSIMRRWAEHMASTDPSWEHLRQAEIGTPDEQVTTVLDTRAHLQQRIAAMAEHRSQRSPFEGLPQDLYEDFLTGEHLIRVRPPWDGGPTETELARHRSGPDLIPAAPHPATSVPTKSGRGVTRAGRAVSGGVRRPHRAAHRPEETPVPSTFRIPRATIDGPYGRLMLAYAKRTWGMVPDTAWVIWHNRKVTNAVLGLERKVAKWDALDPHLASFAQIASAATIGCTWCMDFGYFMAHDEGLDEAKVREVPRWRESDVFTPVERDVMEYAEAMSVTPLTVDDDLSHRLQEALGLEAFVELTQLIALENMRSRFNSAAGLQAQGFSDVCELPLAVRSNA